MLKKLEAFVILLRNSQGQNTCSPVTVANKQPVQTPDDSKESTLVNSFAKLCN